MKKLILLSLLFAFAASMTAQSYQVTMTGSGDTITDTTPDSVVYTVKAYYQTVSIHATFTRISGTAAGNAKLYGTLDGTNYVQIGTDTLAIAASGVSSKIWIVDGSPYYKYKVVFTGSTTLTGSIRGTMWVGEQGALSAITSFTSNGVTVTNSGTGTVLLTTAGWYKNVSIQARVTKTSGTIAGTVTLQGSNDGTNFVTINTAYEKATSATLSCTDQATNTKIFIMIGSPYKYYRLSYTGSGTMAGKLYGYALPHK